LTGAFRVFPFGTQADPQGSGHGRHSIYRSDSGKPTAIKSVNGVFALTLTFKMCLRVLFPLQRLGLAFVLPRLQGDLNPGVLTTTHSKIAVPVELFKLSKFQTDARIPGLRRDPL